MNTPRRSLLRALILTPLLCASTAVLADDFPKGSPKFEKSYRSALSEAKKTGKPILAVFSASWCGPCQMMKKNVYPTEAIKPYHDKFVWAYLDADDKDNEKAMKEFGVNGIPHIQFLSSDGKPVDKQVGASGADSFAKTLDGVLAKTTKAPAPAGSPEAATAATEKK
jgi:thiol:disulfide interchange protein